METSGASPTVEQNACMIPIVVDTLARKKKEGPSIMDHFLLFFVPSQEKAAKAAYLSKNPLLEIVGFFVHVLCIYWRTSDGLFW